MKGNIRTKLLRLVTLVLAMSLALTACGGTQSSTSDQDGSAEGAKILRFGQAPYGDTLDMQISTGSLSAAVADLVTESLLRFDDDNNEEPVLITDFPAVSEDGTVYSFELKEGVYFTNGTELHSSDVKFTFERMFTPATGAKSYSYFNMISGAQDMLDGNATELAGFEIIDDYHFTITLDYAYAPFVKNLGTSYANIFPEDACTEAGESWGVDTNLIGTGPYILQSNDPNTEAVLVKNENYHGGDVNLDELHILFYSDATTKLLAEAGYADGLTLDGGEIRQSEQAIAEAVQGALAEVGITFIFDVVDNATWSGDLAGGKLPFTFISWNALYPDADFQIYNYFYSKNSSAKSVNYNNAAFDALMDEARIASSEDERAQLYVQADQILSHEDMVCVPLYYPQSQFLAKPYVKNMKVGNLIYHLWNVDIDLEAQEAYNG